MIRLRDLKVFNTVMKTGMVTEAARQLHVSQPSVSKTLKDMEAGLGLNLFERQGGRLVPTPEAEILYREISSIFNRIDKVETLVQELRDGQSGSVTVAAGPTLAHTLLPMAIARFHKTHPRVAINIRVLSTPELAEAVSRHEADFGLLYNWTTDGRLAADPIAIVEIGCAMRIDHPLAAKSKIDISDLAAYPLISYADNTPIGALVAKALGPIGELGGSAPIRVNFGLTACCLARELAGLALIDRAILSSGVFPDLVVRPFRPRIAASLEVCIAHGAPCSRAARDLIDQIKAVAADHSARALAGPVVD